MPPDSKSQRPRQSVKLGASGITRSRKRSQVCQDEDEGEQNVDINSPIAMAPQLKPAGKNAEVNGNLFTDSMVDGNGGAISSSFSPEGGNIDPFFSPEDELVEELPMFTQKPRLRTTRKPKPSYVRRDWTGVENRNIKKNALAPKSANHPPGHHPRNSKNDSEIGLAFSVQHVPPPPSKTKPTAPTHFKKPSALVIGMSKGNSEVPRRPYQIGIHAKIRETSVQAFSEDLDVDSPLLASLAGSRKTEGPLKASLFATRDNGNALRRRSCVKTIISKGDVDEVVDPRKPLTTTINSSPPATWIKGKASGMLAGAKRAANRLLKSDGRDRGEGYELLEEGSEPTISPPKKKRGVSRRLFTIAGDSSRDHPGGFRELDSFGEPVDDLNSPSYRGVSFDSLLLQEEDELTLPVGSYVVRYSDSNTVVENAFCFFNKDLEPMGAPLAQSTPGIRFQLRRKGALRFLRGNSSPGEGEYSATGDPLVGSNIKKHELSVMYEVSSNGPKECSEDGQEGPSNSASNASPDDSYRSGNAMVLPGKTKNARRMVEKIGTTNLRGNGAQRGYGQKASKASGKNIGVAWDSVVEGR